LDNELAEQTIKNLAFMGNLIDKYPFSQVNEIINHEITIEWLIKKVMKEANYELVKTPKETIKVMNMKKKIYKKFQFEIIINNYYLASIYI